MGVGESAAGGYLGQDLLGGNGMCLTVTDDGTYPPHSGML